MTEDEAKDKWCPMVRFNDGGANRWTLKDEPRGEQGKPNPNFARCIGSGCMMWRKESMFVPDPDFDPNVGGLLGNAVEGGYCGLAGE